MESFNRKIALVLLVLFVSIFPQKANCECSKSNLETVDLGLELVEQFYIYLFDNQSLEKSSSLFHGIYVIPPRKTEIEEEIHLWNYFRANKKLFLTDRYESGEFYTSKDFFKKARKMVSFYNAPKGKHFCEGYLYITLLSTIARAGEDGVFKEIAFPIFCNKESKDCKIEWIGIKINGVYIDPYNDYERNYHLFERLGFKFAD